MFLYYLRKFSKYNPDCKLSFTTSDCQFQKKISSVYLKVAESTNIESIITAKQDIFDVINGKSLPFSTPWYLVDNVLIPIWLDEKKHWVLAVVSFKERMIRVHNTLSCEGIILNAVLPLAMLVPHYLLLTEFYSRTDMNFTAKCYREKSKTDCFRTVMYNECISEESM